MEPQDSDAVLLRPRPFRKILTLSRSAGHEYVGGLLSAPAMLRVASFLFFCFLFFFLRLALAGPSGAHSSIARSKARPAHSSIARSKARPTCQSVRIFSNRGDGRIISSRALVIQGPTMQSVQRSVHCFKTESTKHCSAGAETSPGTVTIV